MAEPYCPRTAAPRQGSSLVLKKVPGWQAGAGARISTSACAPSCLIGDVLPSCGQGTAAVRGFILQAKRSVLEKFFCFLWTVSLSAPLSVLFFAPPVSGFSFWSWVILLELLDIFPEHKNCRCFRGLPHLCLTFPFCP